MTISVQATNTAAAKVAADLLAVPYFAGGEPGPGASALVDAGGELFSQFVADAGFTGKTGETLFVAPIGVAAKTVLLVGLGDAKSVSVDGLRRAAAAVAKKAVKVASVATTLVEAAPVDDRAAAAQAVTEGCLLGSYRYLEYKGKDEPSQLASVELLGIRGARVSAAVERGVAVADAVAFARDLVNRPAREKSPEAMVTFAEKRLARTGVKVEVLAGRDLVRERMGGVIGVGQGSERPPRFLKLTYAPRGAKGALALVGKGVVFDSGGLSIKTANGMETMKTDMSGGAAVIATMSVLRSLGVTTNVTGYVPLVENMPSGSAIRPGDVLTMRNGKTVEVLNTDAEGRLILADALSLAVDDGNDAIVDLATLTGACMVALGDKVAGLMGNNESWSNEVRAAANRAAESVWPLPLPREYVKQLDSEVADLKNIGGSYGGALTAGLFLEEFVDGTPWVHLDIAGPARAGSDDGYVPRGGTGFGVRTLCELVTHYRAPRGAAKKTVAKSTAAKKTVAKRTPAKKAVKNATRRR